MGHFVGEIFLLGGENLWRSDLKTRQREAKNDTEMLIVNINCQYWTSIKIKISMTCVYKEYEVKIKAMNTAKNKVFIGP